MDSTTKTVYLVFTGHEFADGGTLIRTALRNNGVKASFFFTGDFYRATDHHTLIRQLVSDGHYLGPHSNKHLLYAPWSNRDSLLVSRKEFLDDLRDNYGAMSALGIEKKRAPVFIPPFEWYNAQIAAWCREAGVQLVNFTPGTRANADYTVPGTDNAYVSSEEIAKSILRYESSRPRGLNGFILLTHIGTDPRRTDKFYKRLDGIITELKHRGYEFRSFGSE